MFRLIALYIYYRDLQEERAHRVVPAAPAMRLMTTEKGDNERTIHALAA